MGKDQERGLFAANNRNVMAKRASRATRIAVAATLASGTFGVITEGHQPYDLISLPQADFKPLMSYGDKPFSSFEVVVPEPVPTAHPMSTPRRPEITVFDNSSSIQGKKPKVDSSNNISTGWTFDANISWYGPGFYGHRTACGETLTKTLMGVANKTLACGTMVSFKYKGNEITVPVVDKGPYVTGRQWDLTGAAAVALNHTFTGPIYFDIVGK